MKAFVRFDEKGHPFDDFYGIMGLKGYQQSGYF